MNYEVGPVTSVEIDSLLGCLKELLRELSGDPGRELPASAAGAAQTLSADPLAGLALVARDGGEVVGVLTASFPHALRAGGRYALIEEFYVRPEHRSGGVGKLLVDRLVATVAEAGIPQIEVGLPGEGFEGLSRTRQFYQEAGFKPTGARMRFAPLPR